MHRLLILMVALTALLLAALPTAPAAVLLARGVPGGEIGGVAALAAAPPNLPVFATDFADPFILPAGGLYYAFGTGVDGINVQVMHSADLHSWSPVVDALPALPAWVEEGRTWAPSILTTGDGYILYYTARDRETGQQCISSAGARNPEGPYDDQSARPLICPPGGAIDPQPFLEPGGRLYLHWRQYLGDGAGILRGQRLAADGRTLLGAPVTLMGATQRWQGTVVEAPFMVFLGGRHLLVYSGNDWNSAGYAVGYATCTGPLGPCLDLPQKPFLKSSRVEAGPGGQSIFAGPSGSLMMAYHAWEPRAIGYGAGGSRRLHITAFTLR